ncbi:MAG: hypothetical protein HOY79_26340 [Streptomyces sp.]|nr:hypothetical protein [Streptomyces sp.]
MRASPAVRILRAAVFAVLCVTLAAAGHGLATGAMPPLRVDAAGVSAVLAPSCVLCGRERSLVGICVAMLTAQAGLHAAFDLACSGGGTVRMAGMVMARPAHAPLAHAALAHLLAALVASWWLWRGEAAVWSLLRRAATFVPGLAAWWRTGCGPTLSNSPAARPWRSRAEYLVRPVLLRHALSRRGPPLPGTSPVPRV